MALADQLLDGRCPQGADPVDAADLGEALDAGLCEHAPVAHQHDVGEPEGVAQLVQLGLEGGGIGGVPAKGLHRDRAALAVGEQAEHHLGAVGSVVAAVAVRCERTVAALEPGGADVEQHQATGCEVPSRQCPLDGPLARVEPVERVIQLVLGGTLDTQLGGEGGGTEASRGGQLRGRRQDACHDERQREVAPA